MKILVNMKLEDRHVAMIRAVSEEVEVVQAGSEEEALSAMPEAEVVFGSVSREMFRRAERLRWTQSWGAGVDGLLYPEFVESGIILTSAKGLVGVHLAEHAMALLLGLTRGIARAVRSPDWNEQKGIRNAAWELIDRTMGIVGLGGTGRELATRARGFGMRIIAVDPEPVEVPDSVESCRRMDGFHDLLADSDVISICAPLTPETEGLFDRDAFRKMRNHALLINVTRGKIVDEEALVDALEQGEIGGAGLDVTPQEPLPHGHRLWAMENVLITPHVAGGSPNRQERTIELFCENLRRLLRGEELLCVIDKRKGY